jgi:hypothetical protein
MNVMWGGQSNPYDFHYNGWWPEKVTQALREFGCSAPAIELSGYNMIIKSKKLRSDTSEVSVAKVLEIRESKVS